MEDIFDIDEFVPGLFHLDANFNARTQNNHRNLVKKISGRKISSSQEKEDYSLKSHLRDLSFRYKAIWSDLNDEDVPDPEATIILLGVLASQLGKSRVAMEHFEDALQRDHANLNAISGLVHVCSKATKTQERAADCKKKIADLLGRSEIEVTDEDLSHRVARCLAEQAYAYAYDIGLTTYDERRERILTAVDLYDRALTVGSSVIPVEERRKWYFSMSTVFLTLDTLMCKACEHESSRLPGYNRAINLLKEVIKSENSYHTALAWAYLGILLERQCTFDTTPMSVHDCGFTGCEPVDCYSKSIELAGQNPVVLNRLAKVFQNCNKYELAIGAADMSIQLDSFPKKNRSAFHTRARVRVALYMRDLARCKCGDGSMPDRELLELAKEDLEAILKIYEDLETFIEIGQVCYFMGVDAFKESFIVDEEGVNSALVYFSKALGCDMGNTLPQLQLLRGKCLRIKGEERNALECFKRAIELEREGSANAQAFRFLMETLINWYSHGDMDRKDVSISDIDGWLRLALEKYSQRVIVEELRTLAHAHTHELLDLCKAMVKARKLTLTRLCLAMSSPQVGDMRSKSPPSEVNR